MKHAGGRPTKYTKELADKLCHELSLGKSMRTVCASDDMPDMSSVFAWLRKNDKFLKQYERSKDEGADALNEEILILGDRAIEHAEEADVKASNAVVSAYKLKADNLKWYMSKVKPKKYGDKLDVTSGNKPIPLLNAIRHNSSNKENS